MKKRNKKTNLRFESLSRIKILPQSKRSQIAIFVIIAVVLVVALVLLITFRKNLTVIISGETPIDELKKCIKDATQEGLGIISAQGGSINPQNYFLYQGNKVQYLCYTEENYEKCIMQKPFLKQTVELELENFIQPKVHGCLASFKSSLQKKGYETSSNQPEIIVEIFPNNIQINLNDLNLVMTKDTAQTYTSIKTDINSKLYDLVIISSSILNWEARYGDAEVMNYMMYYPSLKVEKKPQDDGTRIYIITNKITSEKFTFASRSLAIPAGAFEI